MNSKINIKDPRPHSRPQVCQYMMIRRPDVYLSGSLIWADFTSFVFLPHWILPCRMERRSLFPVAWLHLVSVCFLVNTLTTCFTSCLPTAHYQHAAHRHGTSSHEKVYFQTQPSFNIEPTEEVILPGTHVALLRNGTDVFHCFKSSYTSSSVRKWERKERE